MLSMIGVVGIPDGTLELPTYPIIEYREFAYCILDIDRILFFILMIQTA